MIATHHIKVNGHWYSAGEEIPDSSDLPVQAETKVQEEPVKQVAEPEEQKAKAEEKKTSARRRASK